MFNILKKTTITSFEQKEETKEKSDGRSGIKGRVKEFKKWCIG